MTHWYIGCSGFSYKEWKGHFYPKELPQREWFSFYTKTFNALELNNTFYRFPQVGTLQNWYQKAPNGFRFVVKAPRDITHYKKFEDSADLLNKFYDTVKEGLLEKLGAVLFQLPPSFDYSEARLQNIIQQLNPAFVNVIEFRNASWWRPDVIDLLRGAGITFCAVSFPGLDDQVVVNTPHPYYRFHGVPKLYKSSYSDEFLEGVVAAIKDESPVKEAYLFFNNTMTGAAIANAQTAQVLTQVKSKK